MFDSLIDSLSGGRKALERRRPQLGAAGIVLIDAKIKGSITYRNFHAPGKYASYEYSSMRANLVLTKKRLLALAPVNPIIDVPLADRRIRQLRCSQERADLLLIAFDANLFPSDWKGTVEYRVRTLQTRIYLQQLAELTA